MQLNPETAAQAPEKLPEGAVSTPKPSTTKSQRKVGTVGIPIESLGKAPETVKPATGQTKPPTQPQVKPPTGQVPKVAAPAVPAASAGPLNQSDIDSLLAELNAEVAQVTRQHSRVTKALSQPPTPISAEEAGTIGQDDIDALVAALDAGNAATAKPAKAADLGNLSSSNPTPLKTDALHRKAPTDEAAAKQAEIDALLANLGIEEPPKKEPTKKAPVIASSAPPSPAASEPVASEPKGALDQDQIDALLLQMGGAVAPETVQESVQPASPLAEPSAEQTAVEDLISKMGPAAVVSSQDDLPAPKTEGLSQEMLASLVEKHGKKRDETERRISSFTQDDIQNLVSQLDAAGGNSQDGLGNLGNQVADKQRDIDALLAGVNTASQAGDAINESLLRGASMGGRQGLLGAPVFPKEELRGTRTMLAAAVGLLALCALTMGFIVSALNGLSNELSMTRKQQEQPSDDYSRDLESVKTSLASTEADTRFRGVIFAERLRTAWKDHPARREEMTLLLARYYREHEENSKAAIEYERIDHQREGLVEDPMFYIEYAQTLMAIDRHQDARAVAVRLIANEDRFTDTQLMAHKATPAQIETNIRYIRRAHLIVGQIDLARSQGLDQASRPKGLPASSKPAGGEQHGEPHGNKTETSHSTNAHHGG
jgi:hypothetical protein